LLTGVTDNILDDSRVAVPSAAGCPIVPQRIDWRTGKTAEMGTCCAG